MTPTEKAKQFVVDRFGLHEHVANGNPIQLKEEEFLSCMVDFHNDQLKQNVKKKKIGKRLAEKLGL